MVVPSVWILVVTCGAAPAALPPATGDCVTCHPHHATVLSGPMASRAAERAFACRAFGKAGESFFNASCTGCHVATCNDCHFGDAHRVPASYDDVCLKCHRGYFTGWDYYGRAPREDHQRYQRGPVAQGEHYLKMLPDIHQEAGLGCTDCHRIHGKSGTSVQTCRDCHPAPDPKIPEHAVKAHLEQMECTVCHAAWAAQEYGTVLVRTVSEEQQDIFCVLPKWGLYFKSAALRRQDAPPLGLNDRGLVSPIRPEFILLVTDPDRGWENRLLSAEWRAFSPHTIRRGTVTCNECHGDARRFLLEEPDDRIYDLPADGLALASWWDRAGQTVVNGSFFPRQRFVTMNERTPQYVRQHLRRWQKMLTPDAGSSSR